MKKIIALTSLIIIFLVVVTVYSIKVNTCKAAEEQFDKTYGPGVYPPEYISAARTIYYEACDIEYNV